MGYNGALLTILHSVSHNAAATAAPFATYLTSLHAQSRRQVKKVVLYMIRNNCRVADTWTERCNKAITQNCILRSPERLAERLKVNNLSVSNFVFPTRSTPPFSKLAFRTTHGFRKYKQTKHISETLLTEFIF
jgi:hypothetical protein